MTSDNSYGLKKKKTESLQELWKLYLVVRVAAKVRSSQLRQTLQRKDSDGVATLGCILLSDRVNSYPI